MLATFKQKAANVLRRWADSLAPSAFIPPPITINSHEVQRFRILKKINPHDLGGRRAYGFSLRNLDKISLDSKARIFDMLRQEAIVDAADELAKLLTVIEINGREIEIQGEFYFRTK